MKSVDLFLPRILPYVIGCPNPLAKQAVVDAAIEFCDRTNAIWTSFSVSSVAGQAEYDVEVPSQMEMCRVIDLYYGETKLTPNAPWGVDDALALRGSVGGGDPEIGSPKAYFSEHGANTFKVYPLPDASTSNVFFCRASFKPSPTATQLDDVLFNRYGRIIEAGAIYRLTSMPDQPFTSPTTAKLQGGVYLGGMFRSIADARKGAVVTSTRIAPRAFA